MFHVSLSTAASSSPSLLADGADYLKEILPVFFVHQKIPIKRLRQIVHRLLSEDGRRRGGTAGLNTSALHERINAWVASATAGQIRQIPELLRKTGANGAGEKLENKLRRIDARLTELCALGNEVDVVLMSA